VTTEIQEEILREMGVGMQIAFDQNTLLSVGFCRL